MFVDQEEYLNYPEERGEVEAVEPEAYYTDLLVRHTKDQLLASAKELLADREFPETLKKQIALLGFNAARVFCSQLWRKISSIIEDALSGNLQSRVLKESRILEILQAFKRFSSYLHEQIYKTLHLLLEREKDYVLFMYFFSVTESFSKQIDKREQLQKELSGLADVLREKKTPADYKFAICERLVLSPDENSAQIQEQVIFELFKFKVLSTQLRSYEEEYTRLAEVVKTKPYEKVLMFLISSKREKSRKLLKALTDCSFAVVDNKPAYSWDNSVVHPDLLIKETYVKALMKYEEKFASELDQHNFILVGDTIFCKIPLSALKHMGESPKAEFTQVTYQALSKITDLIRFFLSNPDKKIAKSPTAIEEEGQQQSVQGYIVYLVKVFGKLCSIYAGGQYDQDIFAEKFDFALTKKLLKKCLQMHALEDTRMHAETLGWEVAKLTAYMVIRSDTGDNLNYNSEISQLLIKVLLVLEWPNSKWKDLRKIRLVIDSWGYSVLENARDFEEVLAKYLRVFFHPALKIKSTNSFSSQVLGNNANYSKLMSSLLSSKIQEELGAAVSRLKNNCRPDDELANLNSLLFKVYGIHMGKIRINYTEQTGDHLFHVYLNYSQSVRNVYRFRSWIQNHSGEVKSGRVVDIIKKFSTSLSEDVKVVKETLLQVAPSKLLQQYDEHDESLLAASFISRLKTLVNALELRPKQDELGEVLYSTILAIAQQLNEVLFLLHDSLTTALQVNHDLRQQINSVELTHNKGLYAQLAAAYFKLTDVLRFYTCNMASLLEVRDQVAYLEQIAQVTNKLPDSDATEHKLQLLSKLMGAETGHSVKTHLVKPQVENEIGMIERRENSWLFSVFITQDYIPFNFISVIYPKIKNSFVKIIKCLSRNSRSDETQKPLLVRQEYSDYGLQSLLNQLKQKQVNKAKQQQRKIALSQSLLSVLLLPRVNVFGPCYFNQRYEEKGNENQAYGLLQDQYAIIFSGQLSALQVTLVSKRILAFLQICQDRQRGVINKQILAQQRYRRNREMGNLNRRTEIIGQLSSMGYPAEYVQIAIEAVGDQDASVIMDWIEQNQFRIPDILFNRTIEMTRQASHSSQKKSEESTAAIQSLRYEALEERVYKGTKALIKLLVPDLLSETGPRVKNLIFGCLQSFKEQEYKKKQYSGFAQKMFKEMQNLNSESSANVIFVVASCLEVILSKKPELVKQIHTRLVSYKLLELIDKAAEKTRGKILSIINKTLPAPKEKCSPALEQYMHYICDILLNIHVKNEEEVEILSKMTKAKNPAINQKIVKIVCKSLMKGFLKNKLFSIMSLVLDSDIEFTCANIEFDIKSFIVEALDRKNPTQRIYRLDSKKFSSAFVKYEDCPSLVEVVKKICIKKNGKIAYDSQNHVLFASEFLGSSYLAYELPDTQKFLVQSMVSLIVKEEDSNSRVEYIRELYKTLQFYKILIPFCMRLPVEGQSFFEWLLFRQFPKSNCKIISFLTFLFVRNGLFMSFDLTFSDYLIAKVISTYINDEQLRKNNWVKFAVMYFLHIKNFNEKAQVSLSPERSINLKQFLQQELNSCDPIEFALICESLYLILKNEIIERLSDKYKTDTRDEFTLEKQLLNMDLFYSRKRPLIGDNQQLTGILSIRDQAGRISLARLENLPEDEEEGSAVLQEVRRMLLGNLREVRGFDGRGPDYSQIFVPVQPPQLQQAQNQRKKSQAIIQQKEKENVMLQQVTVPKAYLSQIIQKFEEILSEQRLAKIEEDKPVKKPQLILKEQDIKQTEAKVNLKQPRTILDQKFQKTNIFKDRVTQIAEMIDPKIKWKIYQQKKSREVNPNPNGRELRAITINRMMGDPMQPRNNNDNQALNVGRLLNQMEQYVEPKPEPKQVEKKQEPKLSESKMEQEPKVGESKIEEEKPQQQDAPIQEQPVQEPQQPSPETVVNRLEQGRMQQVAANQGPIEPVQVHQQPELMIEQPVEPHRQILAMLGLPQTFLRDMNIDSATFDSLPEDIQIENLNFLMSQQQLMNRNNPNPNPNQQGQAQENQPNPSPDEQLTALQNENAAIIASLDPQLRAQTLLEATPEFLLTLPPAMRVEAENYRQRQISRMLQEEEMEMAEERLNRIRAPEALVYPDLTADNFPPIEQQTAINLAKTPLVKMGKFRFQAFKILLQNKNTQEQAINTLVAYLKNVDDIDVVECTHNSTSGAWDREASKLTNATRKNFIQECLSYIDDHMKSCIYKDKDFLSGKHSYRNFSGLDLKCESENYADEEGYYPLIQLIQIALDSHYHNILNKLIKLVAKLPPTLIKRIARGIRDDKFTDQFYNNLEKISISEEFKQAFFSEFPEDRPIRIETLSKVLKYPFAKLPYLKKLHIETLKKSKGARDNQTYDFLNQVFSIYTVDDVKELEPLLIEHKSTHFYIIKYLYESNRSLQTEPIGLILKFPHLLDFETKRFIFQRSPKLNKSRHRCVMEIDRNQLFHHSFNGLMNKTPRQLQGRVKIVWMSEDAEDAGGPSKEWFLLLSKQIFNPEYALFEPSSSGNTYQPNPKSYANPEHLSYFKFIGRFIAKALTQGMLIDAFFTRSFYKMILGQQLELKDLEEQDYSFYKSMLWLKDNKLSESDEYTFSYVYDYFGKIITKELVPGGEAIKVTEDNKLEYISKYSMAMMRDAIGTQVSKFLEGFYEILPKQSISFFEAAELQLLMSGMPTIDLKDLRSNVDYQGYTPNQPIIKWFWEILEQYTKEDLAKLIQFITGTSKIPLEGFSRLQGMHGPQKISIHKDCHTEQLPKSHTCFNQLDLPNYPTKEVLKQKLRVALTWGSQGFGFM